MTRGIHHLYVETRDWDGSLGFWEALGFRLDEGWGIGQHDGILSPVDGGGPYVFLRQVPDHHDGLAFQVVFGAPDLDPVVGAKGVRVDRPRYASGWGPDLLDVRDPDGRILTIREDATAEQESC